MITTVIICFYSRFSDFLTFLKAIISVKNAMTPFKMIAIKRDFHFLQLNDVKIHKWHTYSHGNNSIKQDGSLGKYMDT